MEGNNPFLALVGMRPEPLTAARLLTVEMLCWCGTPGSVWFLGLPLGPAQPPSTRSGVVSHSRVLTACQFQVAFSVSDPVRGRTLLGQVASNWGPTSAPATWLLQALSRAGGWSPARLCARPSRAPPGEERACTELSRQLRETWPPSTCLSRLPCSPLPHAFEDWPG